MQYLQYPSQQLAHKSVLVQWISLQLSTHYCSSQITIFANLPPPSKCRLVWPAPRAPLATPLRSGPCVFCHSCRPCFSFSILFDATCKIHFTSNSCVLLYWQRYYTALQQQASAKLCGVIQGMQLRNFRRGRHLYSAGRPGHHVGHRSAF